MTNSKNTTKHIKNTHTQSASESKKRKHKTTSHHSSSQSKPTEKKVLRDGRIMIKRKKTASTKIPTNNKPVNNTSKAIVTATKLTEQEMAHKKLVRRLSTAAIIIGTLGLGTTAAGLEHQAHDDKQSKAEMIQLVERDYVPGTIKFSELKKENNTPKKSEVKVEEEKEAQVSQVAVNTPVDEESNGTMSEMQEQPIDNTIQNQEVSTNQSYEKPAQPAMSLSILGQLVYYQNGGHASGQSVIDANSDSQASTWGGAQVFSGDDGMNTHFIGHNPGAFSIIFSLSMGNQIVVTDGNGVAKTYVVNTICQVTDDGIDTQTGENLYDRITGTDGGERITLQSCINNDINLIVFASAE